MKNLLAVMLGDHKTKMAHRDALIEELVGQLAQRFAETTELQDQMAHRYAETTELQDQMAHRYAETTELQVQMVHRHAETTELQNQMALRFAEIAELRGQIAQCYSEISELRNLMAQSNPEIESLNAKILQTKKDEEDRRLQCNMAMVEVLQDHSKGHVTGNTERITDSGNEAMYGKELERGPSEEVMTPAECPAAMTMAQRFMRVFTNVRLCRRHRS